MAAQGSSTRHKIHRAWATTEVGSLLFFWNLHTAKCQCLHAHTRLTDSPLDLHCFLRIEPTRRRHIPFTRTHHMKCREGHGHWGTSSLAKQRSSTPSYQHCKILRLVEHALSVFNPRENGAYAEEFHRTVTYTKCRLTSSLPPQSRRDE